MKHIYNIMLVLVVALCSCTRNDGDIGDWFGTWKLESIDIDGTPDATLPDDIVWKFQSSVFSMQQVYDKHHSTDTRWASWRTVDGYLYLEFTHSDNDTPAADTDSNPASDSGNPSDNNSNPASDSGNPADNTPGVTGPFGTGKYAPLPATHLPSGVSRLEILQLTRSAITLRYAAPSGPVYTYHLTKWG